MFAANFHQHERFCQTHRVEQCCAQEEQRWQASVGFKTYREVPSQP